MCQCFNVSVCTVCITDEEQSEFDCHCLRVCVSGESEFLCVSVVESVRMYACDVSLSMLVRTNSNPNTISISMLDVLMYKTTLALFKQLWFHPDLFIMVHTVGNREEQTVTHTQ